ncbi:glycosyltransferase family 9 protein [Flavivirga rizhaonensis]|uniref:Lipopolysaccharide heptosyltransferase family protein n=1 Tax=Flavivirga rizhaonensis TaxID=2559571 RepID=A0A4V3P5C9_9FLAO|nr:glycosyltransferase family 9 protein [Flavivirga rizhaonensis]TGV04864.1 lipopolysaccharide heptosyltransferase family protein [Flavivirga rizhaonensis]
MNQRKKFLKRINVYKRKFMHAITKNISNTKVSKKGDSINVNEIKNILICRPNHRLGNQLLTSPLVKEVISTFPNCKVDLIVNGDLSPIIFKNYNNVDKIIQLPKRPFKYPLQYIKRCMSLRKKNYDIAINGVSDSSSGRLFTLLSSSRHKIIGNPDENKRLIHKTENHIAKEQIYLLREYLTLFGNKSKEVIPSLDIKLDPAEINHGKKIVDKLATNKKNKSISIFTYATDEKCYSESWWLPFYEKLKAEFNEYNILEILPVENVSQIQFKAPSFYSKDIREIAAVIANTEIFIGADSGIMHLASASQTTTIGLFSVSDIKRYYPYSNNSTAVNTNIESTEDIIKKIKNSLNPVKKLAV